MSHLHPGRRRSARHSSRPPTTRLHPQIDATEDGTGVASHRRSSKRRSSHIQSSEGGDRVTRRCRGKRFRAQTHASEVGDGTSPEPPASPLQVDDLLREILLRLPLDLHSLSRASAVCKPWRGIVVDSKFLLRFYTRHRKPPLLGFFQRGDQRLMFTPVMAPAPDRILPGSFDLGHCYSHVLDSRHGRVLLSAWPRIFMYDPITSKQHDMSIPPVFLDRHFSAAMLCAASDQGHVHGGCHSYPFKVVLVSMYRGGQPIARVYSSDCHMGRSHLYRDSTCWVFS
ncbi:uncharacterized protein [Triticum aestivum]|uniref:uncharacterized protein n=1 Tax=Triticum aestivum TaxID=4565 RepID=UPI000843850D|nr:uncharacterized protein LOC123064584 [Triticum aestivum]